MIFLLIGIAAGVASALYLAYNYHPVLLNGVIHAGIFASGACSNVSCKEIDSTKCQLVPGRRAPPASGNTFHDNRRPSSVDRREPRLAEFLVHAVNRGFKE